MGKEIAVLGDIWEDQENYNLPDNWKMDHNIFDLEYWFQHKKLDIDIRVVKGYNDVWHTEIMFFDGAHDSITFHFTNLKDAYKRAYNRMKRYN